MTGPNPFTMPRPGLRPHCALARHARPDPLMPWLVAPLVAGDCAGTVIAA